MPGKSLEKSILKTVVFYDIFGLPLTAFEIQKYLIGNKELGIKELKFSDILESLNKGLKEKINQREGFYFLCGKDWLAEDRIERQKLADLKWKKLERWIPLFQGFPFIKLILITGSLAFGNVKPESDFDILIFVRKGRIWTVRFLTTLFFRVFGLRRSEKKTRNKICLNHYISNSALEIKFKNLYEAQAYSRFLPAWENEPGFYQKFCLANRWIGDYLVFWPEKFISQSAVIFSYQRRIKQKRFLKFISRLSEVALGGKLGDLVEKFLRKIQREHILSRPLKDKTTSRIIAEDSELEFHPELRSKTVMEEYDRRLMAYLNY
jgi:hypothetical protein